MEKRFFTVEEARQLLPSLKELMGQVMVISHRLEEYREVVQQLADSASSNTGGPEGTSYLEIVISLQSCLTQLQETGCVLKSLQDGLVDFPHLKEGREIYLCWKYGEEDIRFWHEVDEGFAGRTPLLE
jgi:hypothetical protein